MSDGDRPTRHVSLSASSNLVQIFDRVGYEYLTVTDQRAIAIYGGNILLLNITTGELDAVEAFTVEFWAPAPDENRNPERVVDEFVDTVMNLIDERL